VLVLVLLHLRILNTVLFCVGLSTQVSGSLVLAAYAGKRAASDWSSHPCHNTAPMGEGTSGTYDPGVAVSQSKTNSVWIWNTATLTALTALTAHCTDCTGCTGYTGCTGCTGYTG
jgi:hypothetical protein